MAGTGVGVTTHTHLPTDKKHPQKEQVTLIIFAYTAHKFGPNPTKPF
jgi:hypothetical protein